MAGLHFSCGKWLGEDKSANPLFDVLGELKAHVAPGEMESWRRDFWNPYVAACRRSQEEESMEFKLTPKMIRALIGPVRRYRDELVRILGLSGPDASLEERGAFPRTLTDEEDRFLCVCDLIAGNEVCQKTKKSIVVCFA
jgi:hypothetical protein